MKLKNIVKSVVKGATNVAKNFTPAGQLAGNGGSVTQGDRCRSARDRVRRTAAAAGPRPVLPGRIRADEDDTGRPSVPTPRGELSLGHELGGARAVGSGRQRI